MLFFNIKRPQVAKAMVTRFSSISTRKLSKALTVLTSDKNMVAMSDYGAFHKMVKWYILTSVLGAIAQKRNHSHRDTMIENTLSQLHAEVKHNPLEAVNLREIFKAELFRLALRQEHGNESPADGCSQGCSYEGPDRGTEEKNCFKRGGHFTTEWAMYELGKNPKCQDHLYREIQEICGNQKVTEEHLPQLPYPGGKH